MHKDHRDHCRHAGTLPHPAVQKSCTLESDKLCVCSRMRDVGLHAYLRPLVGNVKHKWLPIAEDGEEDIEEDDAQMNLFQEYLLAQEEANDGGQPFHEWAQDHYEAPVRDIINAAVAEMTQQQVSCN